MRTVPIMGTDCVAIDYARDMGAALDRLPFSLRIVAENVARHAPDGATIQHVVGRNGATVPFRPSRLLLQDMLGLALLVDVMALRTSIARSGGDPDQVDMTLPVDLIIDHSLTIEHWAEKSALAKNEAREFEVNLERFTFLKACEARFDNLRVIPPGGGIMHQINLEYLGQVVGRDCAKANLLTPDTNLGTDSHTTMINGLGVLGWGIGGLEAEAIMFGETTPLNVPRVIGLEVSGRLDDRSTATDVALTIAQKLRAVGVVDCFVELFGPGYRQLSVADRATIANMSPEYGATCVFCPTDQNTLRYLRETGRTRDHVARVEQFSRAQRFWAGDVDHRIEFDQTVHLDLGRIGRCVSGPSRPEQRIDLARASSTLAYKGEAAANRRAPVKGTDHDIGDGDIIIAAITSCTNTANPRNMILAGLIARNAVARGLKVGPHVKTSLAPGSRVVADYLSKSGLQEPLDALGFEVAGFSCSTCNGMSGRLEPGNDAAIRAGDIKGVAVLSGNRNFAGRIHPLASRNVLAAPPLVVAYALLGTILKDITTASIGMDQDGNPVLLDDLWPDAEEVDAIIQQHLSPEDFANNYRAISTVSEQWNNLDIRAGDYDWVASTYVTFPPFVAQISPGSKDIRPMSGLRPLVVLGDSITTDHISPSGTIARETAAGKFLISKGVEPRDFNSYGTRRGSSDIVVRSTFSNPRLRNEMVPDTEGSFARIEPDGEVVSVFDAICTYHRRQQELVVVAGRNYGCGSSRDTAAKAPWLAGIRAVIVESFERIHRSNLVNMGIAPLCFQEGVTRRTLALDGTEVYDVTLSDDLKSARMVVHRNNGTSEVVPLDLRLYNDQERETFRNGGLLPRAFRKFMEKGRQWDKHA